jgi:16S rRNA processing protein RimM
MTFASSGEQQTPFDVSTAVSVGRIAAAHGLKGDLKVQPLSDFPNRFDVGSHLWLDGAPVRVERSRRQQGSVFLKLEGVDTRTAAEALRGKELQVQQAQPIYEKGRYYLHDIIGLEVVEADGSALGRLEDVMATGANDVFVVRGERGELLLPVVEDVIEDIDLRGKRIVVKLLPGLEFSGGPKRVRPRPRHAKRPAQTASGYEQTNVAASEETPPSA